MSSLYEKIEKIEKSYFINNLYQFCPKIEYTIKIIRVANQIIEEVDGNIYDIYAGAAEGILFSRILSFKNRDKIKKNRRLMDVLFPRYSSNGKTKIAIKYFHKRFLRPKRYPFLNLICKINNLKIIDLYDEIEKREFVKIEENFNETMFFVSDIYELTKEYEKREKANDPDINEIAIKIVCGYFYIRDFKNTIIWIDRLLNSNYKNKAILKDIKNEIINALSETYNGIKGKKHIVIGWVDALRYDELSNMTMLDKEMKNGIFFEKMFSPAIYTNPAFRAIFTEKKLIDDLSYKVNIRDISLENSPLLRMLSEKEYKTITISNILDSSFNDDRMYERGSYGDLMSTSTSLFYLLCNMEEQDKAMFVAHLGLNEVHLPNHSPYVSGRFGDIEELYYKNPIKMSDLWDDIKMSEAYADEQINYYMDYIKAGSDLQIWMSDHGFDRGEESFSIESNHHVVFSINGKKIVPGVNRNVASLLDVSKYMNLYLNNNLRDVSNFKEITREAVAIQREDPYGKLIGKDYQYKINIEQHIQYRGVVTNEDAFVKVATGTEYYYKYNDLREEYEKINIESNKNINERLVHLQKLNGNRFINWKKEKKYANAKKIYKKYGIKLGRNLEWI